MTQYGDAVEDEWLIVYMIRQLSRSQPGVWARVLDTDGEFLLVEAANVLPRWLSPEIDHNRVWIHNGRLLVIPHKNESGETARNISLPDAVKFIRSRAEDLVHSDFIEEEAFYRLDKYPAQVEDSVHHSLVTIPRRLAYILHNLPRTVAPAVEAFYLRDALALKPILSPSAPLTFPPEDLVTISVRFSKVLFAQLRSQHFETPPRWKDVIQKRCQVSETAGDGDIAAQRLETGMKLTCGFEMLAASAEKCRSRTVREMAILIEDLKEDGDDVLPSDADIQSWPNTNRNDNEAWMDINYEDFERELEGQRTRAQNAAGEGGFGDSQAQDNLRKIVSRFEAFLNDDRAGLDGAELDDMDFDDDEDGDDTDDDDESEDREVSFDEEEFARMMREMMGLPPATQPSGKDTKEKGRDENRETSENRRREGEDEDEDEQIQQLTSQMEAELNKHGALRLEPPTSKQAALKDKSNEPSGKRRKGGDEDEDASEASEEQVDVDYNLAKNILESFKSQGGMSGPTGNLLGMMGINLPRDEDDDQGGQAGPSGKR